MKISTKIVDTMSRPGLVFLEAALGELDRHVAVVAIQIDTDYN